MAEIDETECVVIGAGVIGLAIARALAMAGREVIVLESENDIGTHTSSRNSEVIHAGIYYPAGSLKAELCVSGRRMLYDFCEQRRIPFQRTGKLIVGVNSDDVTRLHAIAAKAAANGVDDLEWLDGKTVNRREPVLKCDSALWSPSTGIVDSHTFMLSLRADIEGADGIVVMQSRVQSVQVQEKGFELTTGSHDTYKIRCSKLINSAGLWAPDVARRIDGLAVEYIPQSRFAKAHYFAYQGRSPFNTLVYPLPTDGGLGIHATLDLAGQARFGPDVEWTDDIDYSFDDSRKGRFLAAIREYFPGVVDERLVPAYTGIRPKLSGPGEAPADFVIQGESIHGVVGLVNLFGIESPGLTSALPLADMVSHSLD